MFDGFILFVTFSLVVLIVLSAFFSSSETSLMAINQIKLDSAEKKGDKNAKRTNNLRKRINDTVLQQNATVKLNRNTELN